MNNKHYKTLLNPIKLVAFNIDRVLTDGKISCAEAIKNTVNTQDIVALSKVTPLMTVIAIVPPVIPVSFSLQDTLEKIGVIVLEMKNNSLEKIVVQYNVQPSETLYIGSDLWDIPWLEVAGLGACPQDVCPEVKEVANYVSHKASAEGCIREIVRQVLKLKNQW